jgi:phosphatidylglycerophosphatase A
VAGFVLFRIFDILKVFPANLFQDMLPGGYGIVMDDVAAGIWGNIVLLLMVRYLGL